MVWKHRVVRFYKSAEMLAKVIATLTAIIAALAFLCPWIGGWVNMVTAERFGVKGYAFYEVAPDPKAVQQSDDSGKFPTPYTPTTVGNFLSPHTVGLRFEDIERGDTVQALSGAFLHEEADKNSPVIYLFRDGECALVIKRVKPEPKQPGYDGGWLEVVTAACGLFK